MHGYFLLNNWTQHTYHACACACACACTCVCWVIRRSTQASTHADVRMCVGKNRCVDTHYQFMRREGMGIGEGLVKGDQEPHPHINLPSIVNSCDVRVWV